MSADVKADIMKAIEDAKPRYPRCPKCGSGALKYRTHLIFRQPIKVFQCRWCGKVFTKDDAYLYYEPKE